MMKSIKKLLVWYGILIKRLLKKPSFLIILLLIPTLTFLMAVSAKQESGFVHVALAAEDPTDSIAAEIIEDIDTKSEIIRLTHYTNTEEAKKAVESGEADTAWVLSADLEDKVAAMAKGEKSTLVKVYASEDGSFVRAAREKLFGALYSQVCYAVYETYVASLPLESTPSAEELMNTYIQVSGEDGIIEFDYLDPKTEASRNNNYLTSPLRGILAVIMLLSTMSATLYFLKDKKQRVFSNFTAVKQFFVFFGNNLAACSLTAVVVTLALVLSGNYTNPFSETAAMIVYVLIVTAFCTLLGSVADSINIMSLLVPIVLVLSLVLSPIFLNLPKLQNFQKLLPPYHYLYGVNKSEDLLLGLIYFILCFFIAIGAFYIKNRGGERR